MPKVLVTKLSFRLKCFASPKREVVVAVERLIIEHCPRLVDLHFGFDTMEHDLKCLHILKEGHWPMLERFSLEGSFSYGVYYAPDDDDDARRAIMRSFLQRHSRLKRLMFCGREVIYPGSITEDVLPSLISLVLPSPGTTKLSSLPESITRRLQHVHAPMTNNCLKRLAQIESLQTCVIILSDAKAYEIIPFLPPSLEKLYIEGLNGILSQNTAGYDERVSNRPAYMPSHIKCRLKMCSQIAPYIKALDQANLPDLTHLGGLLRIVNAKDCIPCMKGLFTARKPGFNRIQCKDGWAEINRHEDEGFKSYTLIEYPDLNALRRTKLPDEIEYAWCSYNRWGGIYRPTPF